MKISHLFPNLSEILAESCRKSAGPFYDEKDAQEKIAAVVLAVRQHDEMAAARAALAKPENV